MGLRGLRFVGEKFLPEVDPHPVIVVERNIKEPQYNHHCSLHSLLRGGDPPNFYS